MCDLTLSLEYLSLLNVFMFTLGRRILNKSVFSTGHLAFLKAMDSLIFYRACFIPVAHAVELSENESVTYVLLLFLERTYSQTIVLSHCSIEVFRNLQKNIVKL